MRLVANLSLFEAVKEFRTSEVSNVKAWAATNNLQLNCSKSREIVFIIIVDNDTVD